MQTKHIKIAIIAALFGTLIFVIVAFMQFQKAAKEDSLSAQMRQQIGDIQKRIDASRDQKLLKEATAPATVSEESTFIADLKSLAKETGTTIVKWDTITIAPTPAAAPAPTPAPAPGANTPPDLMAGVTPLGGTIQIQGDYRDVLRFTDHLLSAPRLYNLTLVSITRDQNLPITRLGMTITRYVEAAATPSVQEGPKA